MLLRVLFVLLSISPLALQVTAQAPVAPPPDWSVYYAETIVPAELRQHLAELTSAIYEGRETAQKGQRLAAGYLAAQFRAWGLAPPVAGDPAPLSYRQQFWVQRSRWASEQMQLQVGGRSYRWLHDYFSSSESPFTQLTTVQPVFVGYGIEQGDYSDYSDYAGLDVRGKDLLVLLGEPRTATGQPRFAEGGQPSRWSLNSKAKLALATAKGARSVFFVYTDSTRFATDLGRFRPYIQQGRLALPVTEAEHLGAASFLISPALGCALLGTTQVQLRHYLAAPTPIATPFWPRQVHLRAPRTRQLVATENVLGYLEGTDRKEEVLVVSAHYDHLGVRAGVVYPGADDNGSGTAAMLAVARAFAQARREGHGPRRSVLFLALTGEEEGLLGSAYYVRRPAVPLAQTVADLNIDMIGRTDDQHQPGDQYLDLVGSDKLSSELHALSEAANQRYTHLALDYRYNDPHDPEQVFYRSDHYNFARLGIPIIFYTTGDHADYHQPTDTLDKIELPLLAQRTRLIFHTAWALANRNHRPAVDSAKP